MVGEMSVRGNVLVGKCPVGEVSFGEVSGRGIVRSGKCPSGKCPLGKCQSGICPRESVSRGSARSGNCPTIVRRCSVKKVFLVILQNSQENTRARVSFLIKKETATLLKKRHGHRCFPVNFARNSFFQLVICKLAKQDKSGR